MKVLETERLLLRGWRKDDAEDMFEYAQSPNVGPAAGWQPHESIDVSRLIIGDFIKLKADWAIVYKKNNKVIGSIGLRPDRKRDVRNVRAVGYVVSEAYWGKGLATEAVKAVMDHCFRDLCLDLLAVYHYTFNDRSRRVIEKCGFVRDGVLRYAHQLYDGTVHDEVCHSITRREYEALYGPIRK